MLSFLIFTIRSAKVPVFVSPHVLVQSWRENSSVWAFSFHQAPDAWAEIHARHGFHLKIQKWCPAFQELGVFFRSWDSLFGCLLWHCIRFRQPKFHSQRPGSHWMFLHVYCRVLDVAFPGRNVMTTELSRQAIMCTTAETRSYHPSHPIRALCWRPVLKSHDMSIQQVVTDTDRSDPTRYLYQ